MTTSHEMAGTLRHRRKAASEHKDASANGDEAVALLVPEDTPSSSKHRNDEEDNHHNDGYILTPLIQRSILARLDVGPFLIGYTALICLDQNNDTEDTSMFLQPVTWALALLLVSHVMLVLMQQWNVHTRCFIGFKRAASQTAFGGSAEDVILSWTHCLVETEVGRTLREGGSTSSSSNGNNSSEAGISPVEVKEATNSDFKVAIVKFHDISFRCPTVSKTLDQDVTIWKLEDYKTSTNDNSGTIAARQLSFHRVRFPTNLPLSFYLKWGARGHSIESARKCYHLYGANAAILKLPSFGELLSQQVVAPFFLFQIFCVFLWSLDEYWYYAIFTLVALLSFESTVAYNQLQSLQRLRNASRRNNQKIWVHRKGVVGQSNGVASSWVRVQSNEIVPGDVISLASEVEYKYAHSGGKQSHQHNTVPADVLLLKGNAIVDESLLTGESIPNQKVAFEASMSTTNSLEVKQEYFDIQDRKDSILFGGTVLLTADYGEIGQQPIAGGNQKGFNVSRPPDDGVVGMVLRTGFETAQGSLLRTIAHSSKSLDGVHTKDTFIFIFLLVCCALASASLVLQDGWEDVTRNRFRLVLHVIIIITSVVPPELPMELSLAVTNSVTDLIKRCSVYCTEVHRVPLAGLTNICCFDKTGTLTSDEMILKGVRLFSNDGLQVLDEDAVLVNPKEDPEALPWATVRIMVSCHSLALRSSRGRSAGSAEIIGNPMEMAILKESGYQLGGYNTLLPSKVVPGQAKSITILHRFAFTSQLKRMTVLVTEESVTESNDQNAVVYAVSKGAPETLLNLFSPESIPVDYESTFTYHMSQGRRVLAMGYRSLGKKSLKFLKEQGRRNIESNLIFCGFLVLECPLKPDSKHVISEIRKSNLETVIITGDAAETGVSVAKQVGIIQAARNDSNHVTYKLQRISSVPVPSEDPLSLFRFVPLLPNQCSTEKDLVLRDNLSKLLAMKTAGVASFCITGDVLVQLAAAALSHDDRLKLMTEKSILLHERSQAVLKKVVRLFSVFARHSPHQKEAVVAGFNLSGWYTLYAGDGCNDMPSLKRAHVGVSIISAPDAESKQRKANASISRLKKAQKKGKKSSSNRNSSRAKTMEESLRLLREAQEEIDQVELGDASVASPFTSKQSSIKCAAQVIQQGRCTLITMLQIYKILGINCLVNAMVLSTLSIHGVKQGDRQLTVLGTAVAALFLFVTRAKPLDKISVVRPPSSVLCLQALLSIGLQFAIHFGTILVACTAALSYVDPFDPSIVADGPFNPNVLNTCTFMLTVLATINTFAVNYRGRPFTENLWENKLLMRSLFACYSSLFLCAFEAFPPLNDLLQLSSFPVIDTAAIGHAPNLDEGVWVETVRIFLDLVDFPSFMCLLMLGDTLLSFSVEKMIIRIFEC